MNRIRIGLVGLVVASLTGLTAGSPASAALQGRGTASSSITLLSVDLGNIQHLKVLTDQGQGTLDPSRLNLAGPQAFASLSAVDATGMLNLALPNPAFKASAPGTSNVPAALASIPVQFPGSALPLAGTALPLGVGLLANGTINPVKIEAHSSDSAVDSIVGTSVPDLSVLQGLLGIKDVNIAGVTTNASATASTGNTGIVQIGSVDVLSLQGLLGGLGLNNLADLPLGTLTGLLDQLGLSVPTGSLGLGNLTGGGINGLLSNVTGLLNVKNGLAGAADCNALTGLVTNNLGTLGDLGGLLSGSNGLLGGLLGTLGLSSGATGINGLIGSNCSTVGSSASGILSIIDPILGTADTGLLGNATDVVDGLLGVLNGAPLISLQGVSLSAIAKAADTLANSSASTSANFGHILVGGKDLGVLDLNATVAQVTALKDSVLGVVNGITSTLGLGNLIDLGILERTASVKAEGSYNVASSALDLLRVSINPPANLSGLLSGAGGILSGAGAVSGILSGLNLPVGNLPLGTDVLGQAFGLTSLLSTPTTIKVGSIGANADYTTAVAGENITNGPADGSLSPGGTLPRTGGTNGAWFAALAAISLAGAFGITRTLRRTPAPQVED